MTPDTFTGLTVEQTATAALALAAVALVVALGIVVVLSWSRELEEDDDKYQKERDEYSAAVRASARRIEHRQQHGLETTDEEDDALWR